VSDGLALLAFLVGLALSLGASEVLVGALSRLGLRLGISAGLLGLLVALGADSPEISSSVVASLSGARDVGVGVILGSNLFNLAALLGLPALIAGRVSFRRALLALDGGVALLATLVAALLLVARISPALAMVPMLLVTVPYVFILARPVPGPPGASLAGGSWRPVLWLPLAIAAIVAGSALMVAMALLLGRRWHLSSVLLGTVVLAALTSLPNAYAAVRLGLRRNGPAVVSEAFNSNTLNLVAGISLPALFIGGIAAAQGAGRDLGWLLAMTVAAIAIGAVREEFSRLSGVCLIAIYAVFLVVAVR
jgi:cation:H+ antiporter